LPEIPLRETEQTLPSQPAGGDFAAHLLPPPFTVRDIFVGADGLRAGWGLLLFAALFLVLVDASAVLVHTIRDLGRDRSHATASQSAFTAPMPPHVVYLNEGVPLFCAIVATWLMGKIERRPFSGYGYAPRRPLRNFFAGLAWGVALLSLLVAILRATGLLVFNARLLFGRSALRYGLIWLAGFLLVALLEEVLTRGYAQFTLTRGLSAIYRHLFDPARANALGFWTAAFILSFAFGFDHRGNPGESPLGLLSAGLAGFLLCLSLWRTGSLWWAIGFHTSWDWAQSFLYGVADSGIMVQGHLFATHPVGRSYLSGGLTGPEGSLFLLPVVLAGATVILLTLPRTHLGYTPAGTPRPSLH